MKKSNRFHYCKKQQILLEKSQNFIWKHKQGWYHGKRNKAQMKRNLGFWKHKNFKRVKQYTSGYSSPGYMKYYCLLKKSYENMLCRCIISEMRPRVYQNKKKEYALYLSELALFRRKESLEWFYELQKKEKN